jgi:phosphoglycerate dehydrogenase-like enzyme
MSGRSRDRVLIVESTLFRVSEPDLHRLRTWLPDFDVIREGSPEDRANGAYVAIVGQPEPRRLVEPGLRFLQLPNVGVDRYLERGFPEGLIVANGRGVFSRSVAEHALAVLLALTRDIPGHVHQQQRRTWRLRPGAGDLADMRVLVGGTGDAASTFARMMRALGSQVDGFSRTGRPHPDFSSVFAAPVELDLLAAYDTVVLMLPSTAATRGAWGTAQFAAMKPGAWFVNVGRGETVDEVALVHAIRSGRLRGVGLDVVAEEPLPAASPLWAFDRVLLTSHSSGATPLRSERFLVLVRDNLRNLRRGASLVNVVDTAAGY